METATHSSTLACQISQTEEPGGLQSMGSQESDMTSRLNSANSELGGGAGQRRSEGEHSRKWRQQGWKAEGLRAEEKTCSCCPAWRTRQCQTLAWRGNPAACWVMRVWTLTQLYGELHLLRTLQALLFSGTLVFQVPLSFFFLTCMLVLWSYPNLSHYILGSTLQTGFNDNPQSQHFNLQHG